MFYLQILILILNFPLLTFATTTKTSSNISMPQPKSQQHSLQERLPAASVRPDTFDGRSENEVIEYKWLQVDPKIKKTFSNIWIFWPLEVDIYSPKSFLDRPFLRSDVYEHAPMKLSTQLRLTALKFTSELAIKEREF